MVASVIVVTVATVVGEAVLSVATELALSEAIVAIKAKLNTWRKQGNYEEIQRPLERAQQVVLNQYDTDEQRAVAQEVLNTLLYEAPRPLVDVFGAVLKTVYSTAGEAIFDTTALAITYRKVSRPSSWVESKLPNNDVLNAIFGAFLATFYEQLLREPTFSFLREYAQLTTNQRHLDLTQQIVEHLDAIRVNTARPVNIIPQLQAEYFSYLENELRELTLRGFAPQVAGRVLSLPLADVFLPLTATEGRPVIASYVQEELREQAELAPQSEIYKQQHQLELEKRHAQFRAQLATQRTLALADLVKEPRAVVLGDPGSGKSTLARYIAYALAVRDATHIGTDPIGRIPILIRIALYAEALERDSTLHLLDYIEHHLFTRPDFGRYVRAEVEGGRCLIILDGLDEVANATLRIRVTEHIQATGATYSLNHFFITSRIVGYEQSRLTRNFKHATIKAMTAAEQHRFIRMWYAAIEKTVDEASVIGSADNLIDTFERKPGVARIATNPLLLTIIVLMHWRGIKMPGRRVQVYQTATDTLLEHWTTLRGIELDAELMKALLAPIAHFILSRSVSGVVSHHELLPLLHKGIIEQEGVDQAESKRQGRIILKALNEQSGLFLERGYDDNQEPVYGFLHQTFGEYLAALHLAHQIFDNTFSLSNYIHRAVWHEPLLLLAGYLSITNPPQLNELLRNILSYSTPYEDILERNALIAIECLADDIHIQPALRQEILDLLARLIRHQTPQVRELALLQYQRIGQTRHREVAVQSLKKAYYDETLNPPAFPNSLNIAIALLHLRERDLAQPILWSISENSNYATETINKARHLRFEFWTEQASEYLYQYIIEAKQPVIRVGIDLENTNIIWLNGRSALRVLSPSEFRKLLDRLILDVEHDSDRVALQWMRILVDEEIAEAADSVVVACHQLLAPDVPGHIRRFAATKLLESHSRVRGTEVLHELMDGTYNQAVAAAEALIASGQESDLVWQIIHDAAWMSQHFGAPQAVEALLKRGDEAVAIPAALQIFATYSRPGWNTQRDQHLYELTTALLRHGKLKLGIAVARWLALRAGYKFRLEVCELMIEYGYIQETIPLLHFLAIECHDESSQRACQRLIMLRELDRVIPLLSNAVTSADPERQYRAALTLALADVSPDGVAVERVDLKVGISSERQLQYTKALKNLVDVGTRELDALLYKSESALSRGIGIASLQTLLRINGIDAREDMQLMTNDGPPALQVSAAYFELRRGAVGGARQRLRDVLTRPDSPPSLLVHTFAIEAMSQVASVDDVEIFIARLAHPNSTIQWSAIHTLIGRNAAVAREHLLRALAIDAINLRSTIATVLGQVQDRAVAEGLIHILDTRDDHVEDSAETALIFQGEMAVEPLMKVVADKESPLRAVAMRILHQLHDHVPAHYFMDALKDADSQVRAWAIRALGLMPEAVATHDLLAMLRDSDSNVRGRAVEALVRRQDREVLDYLPALIGEEETPYLSSAIQDLFKFGEDSIPALMNIVATEHPNHASTAVRVLAKLQDPTVVPYLLEKINSSLPSLEAACAFALGELKAITAIPYLEEKLKSSDAQVRAAAVGALGKLQSESSIQLLMARLHDSSSNVIEASVHALCMYGEQAPIPQLLEVLATSWRGRANAVNALVAIGTEETWLAVVKALGNEDEEARVAAAKAIGEHRQDSGVQTLIACLADDSPSVRSAVAVALGYLKAHQALPLLHSLLDDAESSVRRNVIYALGTLADPSSVNALMTRLLDPDEYVRDATTQALGQLKATQAGELLETIPLPSDLFAFEAVLQRVQVLLRLRPEGVLSVLKYRRHLFRFAPWIAKLYMGLALWSLEQQEAAGKQLLEAASEHSGATTFLPVAHYYLEMGDIATAEQYVHKALEDEPDSLYGLLSKAVILWQKGDGKAAVDHFMRVQALDSAMTEITSLRDNLWRSVALSSLQSIRDEIRMN